MYLILAFSENKKKINEFLKCYFYFIPYCHVKKKICNGKRQIVSTEIIIYAQSIEKFQNRYFYRELLELDLEYRRRLTGLFERDRRRGGEGLLPRFIRGERLRNLDKKIHIKISENFQN